METNNNRYCFAPSTMTTIIRDSINAVDCFSASWRIAMTAIIGAVEVLEKEAVHYSLLKAELSPASFSNTSKDQPGIVIARRYDEAIC